METPPPPEFGPNGAVLNSVTMTERLRREYQGERFPVPERNPDYWAWRLVYALFSCAAIFYFGKEYLWVWLPPILLLASSFVRQFWPVGPRERVIWSILFVTAFTPYGYHLLFLW